MKKLAILLILGILFSYLPLTSRGNCPETDHLNSMKLDCGNLFHCPFILAKDIKNFNLYLIGIISYSDPISNFNGIPLSIYHPPEV